MDLSAQRQQDHHQQASCDTSLTEVHHASNAEPSPEREIHAEFGVQPGRQHGSTSSSRPIAAFDGESDRYGPRCTATKLAIVTAARYEFLYTRGRNPTPTAAGTPMRICA